MAHDGQYRKISGVPYVSHPIGVALITAQYTGNEDAVIAALFHDVLEDVSPDIYSVDRMRDEFGERVTEIVANVSEIKSEDGITRPWRARKEDYIQHLQLLDDTDSLIVSAADKCHNINSMVTDFESVGEELWKAFKASKSDVLWNYDQQIRTLEEKPIPASLKERLRDAGAHLRAIVANDN